MSDITTTLLTYLIHNRIIDEQTAIKIKEESKINTQKAIGEILLENQFFTKEDLLILVLGNDNSFIHTFCLSNT